MSKYTKVLIDFPKSHDIVIIFRFSIGEHARRNSPAKSGVMLPPPLMHIDQYVKTTILLHALLIMWLMICKPLSP